MRKLILFMHVSLDGFVAGPAGEMDWIKVDEEIFDFGGKFTGDADAALYGKNTWQMMDSYWPVAAKNPAATRHDIQHSNWYNAVTKMVLSTTTNAIDRPKTIVINNNLSQQIKEIKGQPGKNIHIYGSPTAVHSLEQENLIDEYWLFVNPVILGAGIPLFRGPDRRKEFELLTTKEFSSGVIALQYRAKSEK
ncbi:dihydrofolate reductase family protein [Terrimonas alba]|uniref:dihydrofolate reductase family protein n=1 Tax=Terrimonas alba TaxID=3349636 RepID=UPI0035F22242